MALRFFALKSAALYCSRYTAPRLSVWRASERAVVAARKWPRGSGNTPVIVAWPTHTSGFDESESNGMDCTCPNCQELWLRMCELT